MATNSDNAELELLRAVAHARMYVTSGRGLESIAAALQSSDLGIVSKLLTPTVELMSDGIGAEEAIRLTMEKEENTHLRAFLASIMSTGKSATSRLDELSEQLHTERAATAEIQSQRLVGVVQGAATIFVAAFVPTFAAVLGEIPENPLLPTFNIPTWFASVWFGLLSVALTVAMMVGRQK